MCRRKLLLLLALVGLGFCQDHECPKGWDSYAESCYKFIRSPLRTRDDAFASCLRYGAFLASVNTMEEHQFITDWLRENDPQHRTWTTSGVDVGLNLWRWQGDDSPFVNMDLAFLPEQDWIQEKYISYNYSIISARWGLLKTAPFVESPYICEIKKDRLNMIIIEDRGLDYGIIAADPLKIERGPRFVREPNNTVFDTSGRSEIDDISLSCVADGYPHPNYIWFKEEYDNDRLVLKQINPLSDPRITITDGTLTIHHPEQTKDRGKYHCQASNKFGIIVSESVQLSFGHIGQFNIKRSPEAGLENWGKAVYCDPPQHYPDVHYYWAREVFPDFVDEDRRVFVSQDGNLYFSSLETIDDARYSCNVQSTVSATGRHGPFFHLEVKPHPSAQQLQFPNNFPKIFPDAPNAGENVRLECIAFGYPVPYYNWTRKGLDTRLPKDATLTNYNRVLILPRVNIEDQGEYVCTANNGKTSISNSVTLSVQAKPVFTIALQDMFVDRGADLTWNCEAFGIPEVKYEWYRNGQQLDFETLKQEDQPRFSIRDNVLQIRALNEQRDQGMYQCRAWNHLGSTYSSGQLKVLTLRPTFEKYPLEPEIYAIEGGNVTIPCRPEAAPLPRFLWKKDEAPLGSSGRRRVMQNGYLVVAPVQREDEGKFTCRAENEFGFSESSGVLRVQRPPVFIEQPLNPHVAIINDTIQLRCQAMSGGFLDLAYIWYLNGVRVNTTKFDSRFQVGWLPGYLVISNVSFTDSGFYECVAKTPVSRASVIAEVRVNGPPGPVGGVQAFENTQNGARLIWIDGATNGRPITSYLIEGRTDWNRTWMFIEPYAYARVQDQALARREFIIDNARLSPWCRYDFRVFARNDIGIGEPSEPAKSFNTKQDRPRKAPNDVGGGGGRIGDLRITWTPMPSQDQNAPGIWYKVFFKKADYEGDFRSEELRNRGNIGRHVISVGVSNFYMQYKVKVQAWNHLGAGPESNEVIIYSAEDIPQAIPTQVAGFPFNSTAISVTWLPIEQSRESIRGRLIGHRIKYWKRDEKVDNAVYVLSRKTENRALILGLQPNTFYSFVVMAYNEAGPGPESELQIERTFKHAPLKPPTSVVVDPLGPTSIQVSFRSVAPSSEEEAYLGFKIRYWEADQDFSTYTDVYVSLGADLNTHIGGLKTGITYKLRVLAYSLGGDGRMSSPAWEFKLENSASRRGYLGQYASATSTLLPSLLSTFACLVIAVAMTIIRR